MEFDTGILFQVLSWTLSSGGAAAIAYFLMEKVPALVKLSGEYKRYASLALAAGISVGFFWAAIAMGYYPEPATTRSWIETLFGVAFVAVTSNQAAHGRANLRS